MITVEFTLEEVSHLRNLMGKDIGWQRKWCTGKEDLARAIYEKVNERQNVFINEKIAEGKQEELFKKGESTCQ